jgi:hypothetical protein
MRARAGQFLERLKVYAKRSQELRAALLDKYSRETQRIFEARLASKFQLAFNASAATVTPRLPLAAGPPARDPNRANALPEPVHTETITLRFSSAAARGQRRRPGPGRPGGYIYRRAGRPPASAL